MNTRAQLHERIVALIDAGSAATAEMRDALLDDLAAYQHARIEPYAKLRRQWAKDSGDTAPVGLPTDVFRFARIAAHPESDDIRVFRTSGTTQGTRGAHAFADLSLYDRAAKSAAKRMLFPDVERMRLILLVPPPTVVEDSSLSYMLGRFVEWFASDAEFIWPLDASALTRALDTQEPVALLGTSFALVHMEDTLDRRFKLAPTSRIMQTGGFKGRSRELDPAEMLSMLEARFGVPQSHIVAEYGMTELSSQMYETSLVDALAGVDRGRRYWAPEWVRVTPVDPTDLITEAPEGILRIEDCANLDSVAALQTADRARMVGANMFELLGRDRNAVPRGCSLAVEEALSS